MKKPAAVDEPPANFTAGAMGTGDAAPGQFFGSRNNVTVIPAFPPFLQAWPKGC